LLIQQFLLNGSDFGIHYKEKVMFRPAKTPGQKLFYKKCRDCAGTGYSFGGQCERCCGTGDESQGKPNPNYA